MDPRRKSQRYVRRLEVLLMVDDEAYLGEVRNLSLSGAYVEVEQHVPFLVEPAVRLHFLLPTNHGVFPLAVRGDVAWIDGIQDALTGFGVDFGELEPAQQLILEAHISSGQERMRNSLITDVVVVEQALSQWAASGLVPADGVERYRKRLVASAPI